MSYLDNTTLETLITYIKSYVQQKISSDACPVGTVQAFAGSVVPEGWLLCDGSAISRTTYAELFNTIGNTFGDGDGETTFNLPDLINKFIEGSTAAGTEKAAGLPNITGSLSIQKMDDKGDAFVASSGAISRANDGSRTWGISWKSVSAGIPTQKASFNASASNAIYGNSTTVQPPAVTMKYIIKY